jgi:hypothetical protein
MTVKRESGTTFIETIVFAVPVVLGLYLWLGPDSSADSRPPAHDTSRWRD